MTELFKGVKATDYAETVNRHLREEHGITEPQPREASREADRPRFTESNWWRPLPDEPVRKLMPRQIGNMMEVKVKPYEGKMRFDHLNYDDVGPYLSACAAHGIVIGRYAAKLSVGEVKVAEVRDHKVIVDDENAANGFGDFINSVSANWLRTLGILDNFALIGLWTERYWNVLAVRQYAADKIYTDRPLLNGYAPRVEDRVIVTDWHVPEVRFDVTEGQPVVDRFRASFFGGSRDLVVLPTNALNASAWFHTSVIIKGISQE